MDTPYEVCQKRLAIRNQDPTNHFVPVEVLERYRDMFEAPTHDEGWDEIIFTKDACIEDSVHFEDKKSSAGREL